MTRSDRRLILTTVVAVVGAAALVVTLLIVFSGGGRRTVQETGPLYLGQKADLNLSLDEGSPLYFANPFGGRGFWLDREDGELVALDVQVPGEPGCSVRWRGRIDTYLDCKGRHLTSDQMARHPIEISITGSRRNGVYVDLRELDPPPSPID